MLDPDGSKRLARALSVVLGHATEPGVREPAHQDDLAHRDRHPLLVFRHVLCDVADALALRERSGRVAEQLRGPRVGLVKTQEEPE